MTECTIDLTRTPHLREMLGIVIDYIEDAKREYCGPYLLALPPPKGRGVYRPTTPPFRVIVTYSDGKKAARGQFKEQRDAICRMYYIRLDEGEVAEVFDAEGDEWIARRGDFSHPR